MEYVENHTPQLYRDVFLIIEGTRSRLATTANAEVSLMHWHIGNCIKLLTNLQERFGNLWINTWLEKERCFKIYG